MAKREETTYETLPVEAATFNFLVRLLYPPLHSCKKYLGHHERYIPLLVIVTQPMGSHEIPYDRQKCVPTYILQ